MKAALQEADDHEGNVGPDGKPRPRDAKGNEILTPEEKAKKDEKARQVSAQVGRSCFTGSCYCSRLYRKLQNGKYESRNLSKSSNVNSAFLRNLPLVQMTRMSLGAGVQYAKSKPSARRPFLLFHPIDFLHSELKKESYGAELLQTIGFVYLSKAKHYLASSQSLFGVGGWLHNVQGKYHVFSETLAFFQYIQSYPRTNSTHLSESPRSVLP